MVGVWVFVFLGRRKEMRRGFSMMICFALLLLTCSNPITPPNKGDYLPPTSPENVLSNLEVAYNTKDLRGYLECLSKDFSFYSPKVGEWDREVEKGIHGRLFKEVKSIDLRLMGEGIIEDEGKRYLLPRSYTLVLTHSSGLSEEASGQVMFYLCQEGRGLWKIVKWRE